MSRRPSRRRRPSRPRPEASAADVGFTAPVAIVPPEVAARRVAVRNPRGRADRSGPGGRGLVELREQTGVGELLLRSLIRAQLGLALRVFAAFGCLLLGLPALFASHPGLAQFRVVGVPLPWAVLGAFVYPVLVLMGLLYVRQAERNEREFVDIVERS